MSRFVVILIPLLLAISFALGSAYPGRPEEPLAVTRGVRAATGLVLRPGESTVEAVRFLKTLRSDPPPPAPPPPPPVRRPPPPAPPPPPPDVAVVFKSALKGIERDTATGAYRALVRNAAAPGPQITPISIGDEFIEGWRVRDISEDAVILAKGAETRVIRLYS